MPLCRLEIERFRCLSSANLEFAPTCNLITGANGSGKTSLLEAIFFLGSGRSFRSVGNDVLVQSSYEDFVIVGAVQDDFDSEVNMGINWSPSERQLRVSGREVNSFSEFALRFPVQAIDPDVHKLIEDGPKRRRQFIDWGVFHVEHSFKDTWRRYNRALKQRNSTLSSKASSRADIWNGELANQGTLIDQCRRRYLESLTPFIKKVGLSLLQDEVTIEYFQGWKRNLTFIEALQESQQSDLKRGVTTVGPHRADMLLKIGGETAKEKISRGQQKMLACTLILAQQAHKAAQSTPFPSLLLDDPAAELDVDNLHRLLQVVSELPVQLFVTALSLAGLEQLRHSKRFHIEGGVVNVVGY